MEEIKMVVIGEKIEYLTTDKDIENVLMQNGICIEGNNIKTRPENDKILVEMPVVFQIDKEDLSKVEEYLSLQGIEIEESRDVLRGKIEEEKACLKEKIEKYSEVSANMALNVYKIDKPDEFKIDKYTIRKGIRKKEIEELEKKIKDEERDKIKNYYQNIAKEMKTESIDDIYISERDHVIIMFNLETKYEELKEILKDTSDYANEDRACREDYLENGLKMHLEIAVLYRLVITDMLKGIQTKEDVDGLFESHKPTEVEGYIETLTGIADTCDLVIDNLNIIYQRTVKDNNKDIVLGKINSRIYK